MVDTQRLFQEINDFAFYSKPSNTDPSALCTVEDINKVINNLTRVLTAFAEELGESQ